MARFTFPDSNGAPGPQGPAGPGVPTGGDPGNILAKVDGTDYNTEWIENYTSSVKHLVKYIGDNPVSVGTPVYAVLSGNQNSSTNIPVNVASNSGESTSSKTMGLLATNATKNDIVYVITEGLIGGIDTSTATTGDPVWLGPNGTYIFGLANKPVAPAHLVFLGVVTRGQQINGEIFVKVQNGFEINELHDVLVGTGYSSTPADNDLLAYDAASGLWKNQTAAQAGLATVSAGSVLKDTMLSNSELNVLSTTIAQTTSNVNFVTYNYTPVSSSSYLMIDFHLSKYVIPGSMDDSYYSILLVDGNEISYGYQAFNDDAGGTNNRSGVLFPLTGRYTNSSTSTKQIQVAARRGSADDSISIDSGTPQTMWLRITEVAR
jgi:hypothetical protein